MAKGEFVNRVKLLLPSATLRDLFVKFSYAIQIFVIFPEKKKKKTILDFGLSACLNVKRCSKRKIIMRYLGSWKG